ncbi:hypothetical protein C8R45DRAFT_934143 [Mycena sanguinolenta]|nr:hypothetical protein C8R45DRAFT_934143 [Mycena sanguinolenta]
MFAIPPSHSRLWQDVLGHYYAPADASTFHAPISVKDLITRENKYGTAPWVPLRLGEGVGLEREPSTIQALESCDCETEVARVHFKKVTLNHANMSTETALQNIKIDTEIDCMFELSGILLAGGTLQRLTREFYWKCIHNTFRVGDFWLHIEALSVRAEGQTCRVPDTLEHIALECTAPGQSLVHWPTLNWGLVLGCNLITFNSDKGLFENPDRIHTEKAIHNRWLKGVNNMLMRDRLLTNKIKFGPLAFNKQMVLNTWSGILANQDSLPDDWVHEGVLAHPQLN